MEQKIPSNGNRVKEVRVSESSRRDARGVSTKNDLLEAIDNLETERSAIASRKFQIQARLTEIRNAIRGKSLPSEYYSKLCDEQTELGKEVVEVEKKLSDLKQRKHRLNQDLPAKLKTYERTELMVETNVLLGKILRELEILNGRQRA